MTTRLRHRPIRGGLAAGVDAASTPLPRAYPLLIDDVITGPILGRPLAHATAE